MKRRIKYKGKRLNPAVEWYKLGNSVKMLFTGIIFELISFLPPSYLKNFLYRIFGVKIGKDVSISPHVILDPLMPEKITIGDGTIIGWGARIFVHEYTHNEIITGEVKIGKNVLIGGFSLIEPGITIGDNSIVGSMSFVNKDVPLNTMVGGVPVKKIKKLK